MRIRLPGRTFVLASIGVALLATAAVAGSGVGGVFNLGQTNTVDVRTLLQGNTNVQLHVVNQSTAVGSVGVLGTAGGVGVLGQSVGRVGVRASAIGTTGTNYGLYGETASRDGYAGHFQNTGSRPTRTRGAAVRGFGAGATGSHVSPRNMRRGRVRRAERGDGLSRRWRTRSGVAGLAARVIMACRRLDQSRGICRLLPEPQRLD